MIVLVGSFIWAWLSEQPDHTSNVTQFLFIHPAKVLSFPSRQKPGYGRALSAVRDTSDAARLEFRVEPRKIVGLQRDGVRGAAQQSCQPDDLSRATVLPAKGNLQ